LRNQRSGVAATHGFRHETARARLVRHLLSPICPLRGGIRAQCWAAVRAAAADAAAGNNQPSYARQLRSELKIRSALPFGELRAQADSVAREYRELDVEIQRSNWEVDLLD